MSEGDNSFRSPSLISIATVISMAFAGTWALFQTQLAATNKEIEKIQFQLDDLRNRQIELITHGAHDPVEKATVDATNIAVDKRVELLQGQITDINRQIAAALIIIDNNSGIANKHPTNVSPQ